MSQHVDIKAMAAHEFAATVEEGRETTHHRVVLPEEFAEEIRVQTDQPAVPDHRIVSESLSFLLSHSRNTELPHDIDLSRVSGQDERFLPELRDRLVALA
ncbi:hypothetical protein JOF53_007731 [Crossiella equi]|uniref:Uncharacterized protein n=1 Tax=Crossiella equi TaxID=130796 RepID=A0ABS5AQL4_9PSEU|nr:hypothetical protein [Crossiella equi]MBP2478859.1 hypothetical protein [Crossiella equi]